MNSVAQQSPFTYDTTSQPRVNIPVRPPIFQTASDHNLSPSSTFEQEGAYQERKMMQCDSAQVNPFSQNMSEGGSSHESYQKIDSKDSMWKPAPIMGREISQHIVPSFSYNQPSITSQLKSQQELVLSQTFNKLAGNQQTVMNYNTDSVQIVQKNTQQFQRLEEDTERRMMPGNHATIVQGSSSLPDFVSAGQSSHGEGRVINAAQSSSSKAAKLGTTSALSQSMATKRPTTTQAPGSAVNKKK
ncbi:hypothetical protein FGO68_gene3886 [Halteria grandinella]|uniref:Uncharacterized protein n=1 Tax=Halteria grandinella TaxID=5974 RepID=A0A8J8SVD4_HALGN|nr:hypothetical protein FGO68_gene3886 [Halteria grandinella]